MENQTTVPMQPPPDAALAPIMAIFSGLWIAFLIYGIVMVVAMWKVFSKAGKPGWAAIVPIYNFITLLEIAGRPTWWILLLFIPVVNVVITLVLSVDIAKAFGKSEIFGIIALWLLNGVGFLFLGFGSSKYVGKSGVSPAPAPPAPTPDPASAPPATPAVATTPASAVPAPTEPTPPATT